MTTTKPTEVMLDIDLPEDSVFYSKGASYVVMASDDKAFHRCTGGLVATMSPATVLGNGWSFIIEAAGGDVSVVPDGAETINGGSTLVVRNGNWALVYCSGTALYAIKIPTDLWGNFTIHGTLTVTG